MINTVKRDDKWFEEKFPVNLSLKFEVHGTAKYALPQFRTNLRVWVCDSTRAIT